MLDKFYHRYTNKEKIKIAHPGLSATYTFKFSLKVLNHPHTHTEKNEGWLMLNGRQYLYPGGCQPDACVKKTRF